MSETMLGILGSILTILTLFGLGHQPLGNDMAFWSALEWLSVTCIAAYVILGFIIATTITGDDDDFLTLPLGLLTICFWGAGCLALSFLALCCLAVRHNNSRPRPINSPP